MPCAHLLPAPTCTAAPAGHAPNIANFGPEIRAMKIILWLVAIVFLIGLAVVFGLGSLIF